MFLLMLKSGNKSTGALDNASGMAIVFELSKFFKKNPLTNFNIWLCQFSAEEITLLMEEYRDYQNTEDIMEFEKILQNTLILLVSHFAKKDETVLYKPYTELSETEKALVKQQLSTAI